MKHFPTKDKETLQKCFQYSFELAGLKLHQNQFH